LGAPGVAESGTILLRWTLLCKFS